MDYSESDLILTFYTEEFGKIKGIAKGARRSRRRFVGTLDVPSHIRGVFHRNDKSDLVRVEAATLAQGFSGLKSDILRYANACCLLELVSEATREGQASPAIYGLLLEFLNIMESAGHEPALRCFFEIKLLALAGFQPHLDGCVLCRSAFDPASVQRIYFSSERGGTVCARCSGGLGMPISLGTARTLSNAARSDVNKLSRLKSGNGMVAESETLLDDFIRHHIGKELKTKRFLARLKNPRPCSSVP
ncbi:MAG: DNA repair protein RecO [Deltaproteobacteria bacterium RIFCSPLOWO2_02_FULL_53_8]|nr:MAG: DNA repair protein RecO [Deltaproteobacteria bacterium RIFCSPLOWO2_02_FULL_53_8]